MIKPRTIIDKILEIILIMLFILFLLWTITWPGEDGIEEWDRLPYNNQIKLCQKI